jgi:hypothetical protein
MLPCRPQPRLAAAAAAAALLLGPGDAQSLLPACCCCCCCAWLCSCPTPCVDASSGVVGSAAMSSGPAEQVPPAPCGGRSSSSSTSSMLSRCKYCDCKPSGGRGRDDGTCYDNSGHRHSNCTGVFVSFSPITGSRGGYVLSVASCMCPAAAASALPSCLLALCGIQEAEPAIAWPK